MALHGDRPPVPANGNDRQAGVSPTPAATSGLGSKRAASPTSPQLNKKAKSEGVSPKPAGSDRVRTVIEVLNAPRIESPLCRAASSREASKASEAREEAMEGKSGSRLSSEGKETAIAEKDEVSVPAKETTPPVPHIQTDAAADAVVEASKESTGMEGGDRSDIREASATAAGEGDVVMTEEEGAEKAT